MCHGKHVWQYHEDKETGQVKSLFMIYCMLPNHYISLYHIENTYSTTQKLGLVRFGNVFGLLCSPWLFKNTVKYYEILFQFKITDFYFNIYFCDDKAEFSVSLQCHMIHLIHPCLLKVLISKKCVCGWIILRCF